MDRRIRRLERSYRGPDTAKLLLFWDDELAPCRDHPACAVEKATGAHLGNVVRLRFEEGRE